MLKLEFKLQDLISSHSFKAWTFGYATDGDIAYWDKWVAASQAHRELTIKAQQRLTGIVFKSTVTLDPRTSWEHLEKRIQVSSSEPLKSPKRGRYLRRYVDKARWQKQCVVSIKRAATILLIIAFTGMLGYVLTSSGLTGSNSQEDVTDTIIKESVRTDFGERKTISLSDGSIITLNANSRIEYATDKNNPEQIDVNLNGEAYFMVSRRESIDDATFRVTTTEGAVEVLGTQFVVSSRNNNTQVVLEEGSLTVSPKSCGEKKVIRPGQMAELITGLEDINIIEVNTDVYTSWRTNQLVFDETPLSEVISRLKNTFGVTVEVRDSLVFDRKLSGSVGNFNIEIITSAISKSLDKPLKIENNTLYVGK